MECTNAERPEELKWGGKEGYEATDTAVGKKFSLHVATKNPAWRRGFLQQGRDILFVLVWVFSPHLAHFLRNLRIFKDFLSQGKEGQGSPFL